MGALSTGRGGGARVARVECPEVDERHDTDEVEGPAKWTAEQRQGFARAYEVCRRRQITSGRATAGALLALVAAGVLLRLDAAWWVPAVGIVALAALIFRLTNWKCPACGERLPTRSTRTSCFGCGLPLE